MHGTIDSPSDAVAWLVERDGGLEYGWLDPSVEFDVGIATPGTDCFVTLLLVFGLFLRRVSNSPCLARP